MDSIWDAVYAAELVRVWADSFQPGQAISLKEAQAQAKKFADADYAGRQKTLTHLSACSCDWCQ